MNYNLGIQIPSIVTAGVEFDSKDIKSFSNYLLTRIDYIQNFLNFKNNCIDKNKTFKDINIKELREAILDKKFILNKPVRIINIKGTFFPSTLMSIGWWEKKNSTTLPEFGPRDSVKQWLLHGFEYWGPSVDVNPEQCTHVFGQIGYEDESFSIPIIIEKTKIPGLINKIKKEKTAVDISVTGDLYHLDHLKEDGKIIDNNHSDFLEDTYKYCIIVNDCKEHDIGISAEKPVVYSAYIWQCWVNEKFIKNKKHPDIYNRSPKIQEVFFAWEHTNLANRDAINYNIDGLTRKKEYISKLSEKDGKLFLLFKYPFFIPGEPIMSKDDFCHLFTQLKK